MKLIPKYSYEFNDVLNTNLVEKEEVENFASLLSDKDRFLSLLPTLEKNAQFIEKSLGYNLREWYEFFVVRAELFKSFSEPITIEYSILPEEMLLFLFKEIVKVSITDRFLDEVQREELVNALVDYCVINGDFDGGGKDFVKFTKNLHDESSSRFESYEYKEFDFSERTLKDILHESYKAEFSN